MKIVWFFLISALLHATLFVFHFPQREGTRAGANFLAILLEPPGDRPIRGNSGSRGKTEPNRKTSTIEPPSPSRPPIASKQLPSRKLASQPSPSRRPPQKKVRVEQSGVQSARSAVKPSRVQSLESRVKRSELLHRKVGQRPTRSLQPGKQLASKSGSRHPRLRPKNSPVSKNAPARLQRSSSQRAKAAASTSEQPRNSHKKTGAASPPSPDATRLAPSRNTRRSQTGTMREVRYAHITKPRYPRQARTRGWEGTTILKVLVDPEGKSEIVEIHRTSGFRALDEAARQALETWRFHPARYGEKPVASWVHIPVVFKLNP